MRPSTKAIVGPALAICAALLPTIVFFGFMVDDALITGRVAHHLATGIGYRFNPTGPVVDAVTPLGWAWFLAPFAKAGPWSAFIAAKWIGLVTWLGGACVMGGLAARLGTRALAVIALALASCVPLAAWAVSGMETGVVTALCALALVGSPLAPLALGIAAGLRPELLPWAATLGGVRALFEDASSGRARFSRVGAAVALATGPFILVAIVRLAVFGQAFPLSLLAKPPDTVLGFRYLVGALAFSGPVWLLLAGRTYGSASALTRATVVALASHGLAIIYAGGDWMPFYRLFVPVLPSIILAGGELAQSATSKLASALRVVAMLLVSGTLVVTLGRSAMDVVPRRKAVIEAARPALAGARNIAALDVGWVGTASSASIVDLAGVTDPSIARLRGSHTAKRLPEGLLEVRAVDAVVVFVESADLGAWPDLPFVHPVEERLSTLLSFSEFRPVARIPLAGTSRSYVVARRSLGP